MVVERGNVGRVGGILGECVSHLLCHGWMLCWFYWEGCWSVGVQLRLDVLARMGGGYSCQVGLGVEWLGEEGVKPVDTNISFLMLHESSFVGNRGGQY